MVDNVVILLLFAWVFLCYSVYINVTLWDLVTQLSKITVYQCSIVFKRKEILIQYVVVVDAPGILWIDIYLFLYNDAVVNIANLFKISCFFFSWFVPLTKCRSFRWENVSVLRVFYLWVSPSFLSHDNSMSDCPLYFNDIFLYGHALNFLESCTFSDGSFPWKVFTSFFTLLVTSHVKKKKRLKNNC